MITLDTIKHGVTFQFIAAIKDADGNPLEGEEANLKAEVRTDKNCLLSTLSISETATLGSYLFSATTTVGWPIETVYSDIQLTKDGVVSTTETIAIPVEKDITA